MVGKWNPIFCTRNCSSDALVWTWNIIRNHTNCSFRIRAFQWSIGTQLALNWLESFHLNTKDRLPNKRKQPRLLTMDGHRSNLTFEFLERCDFYNIIPYVCPAYTTHLVQTLDGPPFRSFKRPYRTKNNKITQWGGDARDISVFFTEVSAIWEQALQPRTIRTIRKVFG